MSFGLTELRADVDALLAATIDTPTWSAALKDAAIRSTLQHYDLQGPIYEADLPVTTAGHEQPLGALAGLLLVELIAWPWHDGLAIEERAAHWRLVGPATVRFDSVAPQVGDLLRVRYRRTHTLAGLDGAADTTVPDAHRFVLAEGAAAAALALRLRQISENPALPGAAAAQLQALHEAHASRFVWLLERMQGAALGPVWAGVGL